MPLHPSDGATMTDTATTPRHRDVTRLAEDTALVDHLARYRATVGGPPGIGQRRWDTADEIDRKLYRNLAADELRVIGEFYAGTPDTCPQHDEQDMEWTPLLRTDQALEVARAVSALYHLDWTGYPKTLPRDHRMTGGGDLALFLGGDCSSFTGDLVRLIDKSRATLPHFHALLRGFPHAVVAWSVWQALPMPTAGQLADALRGETP